MYNVVGMYRNSRWGFTMLELLIAIAMMALISAAVASTIGPGSKQTARDTQRRTDINAIAGYLEMYRNDIGSYPATLGLLVPNYYLTAASIPTDPTTHASYSYSPVCAPCRSFNLCANSMERPPATPYCVRNP